MQSNYVRGQIRCSLLNALSDLLTQILTVATSAICSQVQSAYHLLSAQVNLRQSEPDFCLSAEHFSFANHNNVVL